MTKKLSTLLLIIGFTFFVCKAQESYLTIGGGYAVPQGVFASNDLENEEAGFAQTGSHFNLEMAYYLNNNFGFGAILRFNNLGHDEEAYNSALSARFKDELDSINLASGDYTLQNFLIGPSGKINIGNFLSVYGKAYIGVLTTFRPPLVLVYRPYGQELITKETIGKYRASFSYHFGLGAILKISERFGINLSADYTAGNPTFQVYNPLTLEDVERKQPVAFIDYNAGLVLRF